MNGSVNYHMHPVKWSASNYKVIPRLTSDPANEFFG